MSTGFGRESVMERKTIEGNFKMDLNPLNPELNPICYLLA